MCASCRYRLLCKYFPFYFRFLSLAAHIEKIGLKQIFHPHKLQIKNNFKDCEIGYEMKMGSFDHFVLKRKLLNYEFWFILHRSWRSSDIETNQPVVHLTFYEYISKDYVNTYEYFILDNKLVKI